MSASSNPSSRNTSRLASAEGAKANTFGPRLLDGLDGFFEQRRFADAGRTANQDDSVARAREYARRLFLAVVEPITIEACDRRGRMARTPLAPCERNRSRRVSSSSTSRVVAIRRPFRSPTIRSLLFASSRICSAVALPAAVTQGRRQQLTLGHRPTSARIHGRSHTPIARAAAFPSCGSESPPILAFERLQRVDLLRRHPSPASVSCNSETSDSSACSPASWPRARPWRADRRSPSRGPCPRSVSCAARIDRSIPCQRRRAPSPFSCGRSATPDRTADAPGGHGTTPRNTARRV